MPRVLRVNHIGLATASVGDALRVFGDGLGLIPSGSEEVPDDKTRVTFAPLGELRLEFLEPDGDEGPVQKFLDKRGPGIHHICLEVDDLPGMLDHLRHLGVELVDDKPRPGAHGSSVAFIHPKSANGVLIELVENGEATGLGDGGRKRET